MNTRKKQIGDRVMITAGQNKDKVGIIVDKERRGWTIELEDGSRVTASFPMVSLVEAPAQVEHTGEEQVQETSETESTTEAQVSQEADSSVQHEETPASTVPEGEQDITKMTVKQLQALAKQRGISIARTKTDFLKIIKEKNPDEDFHQLKGKILFDRVSELHISRLRTKDDLVILLQA
ncbi:MAG: KOW motif-containing protein [Candidatus Hatepunaea meridiana]|nr:KOW motif-containing protein [Candidatus Hatepunaea meridiana]